MDRKIKKETLLASIVFSIIIFIGTIYIFTNIDIIMRSNFLVITTFLINGILTFVYLSSPSSSPYRLRDVTNVFMFIFMFAAPLVQYLRNDFPWWNTNLITDEILIFSNLVILIFLFIFNIFFSSKSEGSQEFNSHLNNLKRIDKVIDIFWIFTLIVSVFIISRVGVSNLFARSTNSLNISNQSLWLIVNYSFRSISVIYVAMSIIYYQKHKKIYKPLKFLIGLTLMIITNFPTGLPRFWVGSVYIGLFAILFNKKAKANTLKILLIFGLLIIFPVINTFRNLSFNEVINNGINLGPITDYFLAGDFDSYSMLARSIITVKEVGISMGSQLLGSLLFFIPRGIWPSKPVGSGFTVASLQGWSFKNVSMPLIGEGYLNFGVLGVILFAIFLGLILSKMDNNYFKSINKKSKSINFIEIVFPFTLGFFFFIMRGDLLSSWGYYVGFMMPLIVVFLINKVIK